MHTSILLPLFSLAAVFAEISIVPVPSYVPTINVIPVDQTSVPTDPALLTIIPLADNLAPSSVIVEIPAVSTMEPMDEVTTMDMPEATSIWYETVPAETSTTTVPGVVMSMPTGPTSTSTTTKTSVVTPTASQSSPSTTGKANGTGPIETSGVEGRGFGEVKMVSLALVGVLGIFIFA